MSELSSSLPAAFNNATSSVTETTTPVDMTAHRNSFPRTHATTQYHAQLYSGQQQLQRRQLQQMQNNKDNESNKQRPPGAMSFVPPNLYRTSLRLVTELEMDAWWSALVSILTESSFHAIHVSLSVPQDSNDPWTGAWGLKASWSKTRCTKETMQDKQQQQQQQQPNERDYFAYNHHASTQDRLKCFDRIHALESDAEPLINNASAHRIIRRNAIIVLSREYRPHSRKDSTTTMVGRHLHLHHHFDDRDMFKRALLDQTEKKRLSAQCSLHDHPTDEPSALFHGSSVPADMNIASTTSESPVVGAIKEPIYDYDEYEQQQPSPWSQSPAPSPAMMDPDVNPFFQSVPGIDDEAFNPESPESSYESTSIPFPPPASNVHSVVHIPLVHPTPDTCDSYTSTTTTTTDPHPSRSNIQPAPFAIVSFLTPVVPYPSALVTSLSALAPFISSSCSNAFEHARRCSSPRRPHLSSTSSVRRHSSFKSRKKSPIPATNAAEDQQQDSISHQQPSTCSPDVIVQQPTCQQPAFLSSISSFMRNSLETVTEAGSSASPSPLAAEEEHYEETVPPWLKASNEGSALQSPACSDRPLSPSSMAILEGWAKTTTSPPQSFSAASLQLPDQKRADTRALSTRRTRVVRRWRPRMRWRLQAFRALHPCVSMNSSHDDNGTCSRSRKESRIERLFVAPKSSLLRLVIDGIPIHVFTCSTTTGQVTWVNNRILQYTGRPLQEHLGPGWLSHMHPDDQMACRKAWEMAFEQGNGFAGEYRLRRFDGNYRFFLWRIVPLRDLKGRIIHWFGTCTDVHDQHSTMRQMEIESNERKYRLLAEAIPQIVFTFSPGVGVTYANEKWECYSGVEFDRTKGFGFMSQVHADDRQRLQLPDLAPHKTAGIIWQSEIRLLSKEGEYRWFLVKCISVDELDTGNVRWFGTCTDINDHKLLEHKLKEAHDAAQKSMESKTRFLSNMSHEIRTPLIGITGMLNFLLDTDLTPEQLDYAHTIQQSAESLLVVINDILDLSKVEAGMMKLEWEPFRLVSMIEDANELLSTLAIQKGLELSFWVDESVPEVVVGDRVRLRQVLLNLIGNAIKFTTEGEVFTQCTVEHLDTQKNEMKLLFEVVDTGSGFDSDGEAVMFKPFSQIDSSSTRKHGGSGLGLVISRQLIELHGGEMRCKSKKGEGSTFYFTVKFSIPPPQTRPRPQTPQNETTSDPFFRTSVCTSVAASQNASPLHQQPTPAKSISSDSSSNGSLFIPSPLAHSKKHSQANDLPTSMELLQDALLNKAATMRLMPPPTRGAKQQQQQQQQQQQSSTLTPPRNKERTPQISLSKPSPPTMSSVPPLGLLSPNSGIILPPRTPTRGSPLRILVVSEWPHARDTIVKHLRAILGGISNQHHDYQLHIATNHIEATQMIAYPQAMSYDYVALNLASDQHVLGVTRLICGSMQHKDANTLVITTPMQRSLIMESAKDHEQEMIPANCSFVFKPIKRSKLNWYFGVRQHDLASSRDQQSNDPASQQPQSFTAAAAAVMAPDSSQKRVATQKELFRRMEQDVGGKGYRVMLVEDNLVNQKVLTRYLVRVGLDVEVASDGQECVDMFLSHPPGYYSIILCDLFMPVKDGYEATRDIRRWEHENSQEGIPIVALSANVMSDVAQKCMDCGFSTYISKPVNFATLSDVIRKHLLKQ